MASLILVLKFLTTLGFIAAYDAGGQGHKPLKSWLAPLILVFSFTAFLVAHGKTSALTSLGSVLYLAAANGFAYGKDETKDKTSLKILFRGLAGASWGLCGFLILGGIGHWVLGVVQLVLATAGSIFFGVVTPFAKLLKDRLSPKRQNLPTILEDTCISLLYVIPLVVFI